VKNFKKSLLNEAWEDPEIKHLIAKIAKSNLFHDRLNRFFNFISVGWFLSIFIELFSGSWPHREHYLILLGSTVTVMLILMIGVLILIGYSRYKVRIISNRLDMLIISSIDKTFAKMKLRVEAMKALQDELKIQAGKYDK